MTGPSAAFVSELARELGATDPVEAYYRPLTGQWDELTEEAARLRAAAGTAARVSAGLAEDLGKLDAVWRGPDADAFVAYLGEIRSASEGAEDALEALAGALEELSGSVRRIVEAAEEILVDAADVLSESALLPAGGSTRARAQLRETGESLQALHASAQDVLQQFGRLCDGMGAPPGQPGIELRRHYPAGQFRLAAEGAGADVLPVREDSPDLSTVDDTAGHDSVRPSALEHGKETAAEPGQTGVAPIEPPPAAAPASPPNQGNGLPMMPMMGFGGLGGDGGGKERPRKGRERFPAKPGEIFGEPDPVTPPVLGERRPASS